MPREKGTPICGAAKIACYNQAKDNLLKKKLKSSALAADDKLIKDCNCLPACASISYDADIVQASFDWISLLAALDDLPEDSSE